MLRSVLLVATLVAIARGEDAITPLDPHFIKQCDFAAKVAKTVAAKNPDAIEDASARIQGFNSASAPEAVPCLVSNGGWWSYELCWNRYLRQIHVENNVIMSEYFLGLGHKAADDQDKHLVRKSTYATGDRTLARQIRQLHTSPTWAEYLRQHPGTTTMGDGSMHCNQWVEDRAQLLRFRDVQKITTRLQQGERVAAIVPDPKDQEDVSHTASTIYDGGTICDLTKNPRRTLMVLTCEHTEVHLGFNVSEESPCVYVAYLFGNSICSVMQKPIGPSASAPAGTPQQGAKTPQPSPAAATEERIGQPSRYDAKKPGERPQGATNEVPPEGETAEDAVQRLLYAGGQKMSRGARLVDPDPVPDAKCEGQDCRDATQKDLPPPFEGSLIFTLRP